MKSPIELLEFKWPAAVLIAIFGLTPYAMAQSPTVLRGCASHTPPFMIFAQKKAVAGFSFELVKSIADQMALPLEVTELPWARCLQEVQAARIDVAIDAYDDQQKRGKYLYSVPYHTLTPHIFYRAESAIEPQRIKSVAELRKFKGCGIREYTYEHYQLEATLMDRGAPDDRSMLLKLRAGHCDFAVEELEYIVGGRTYLPAWLDESNLRSFRPEWAKGPKTHFLIGLHHPNAQFLVRKINLGIQTSRDSGDLNALAKRYLEPAGQPARSRP